MKPNISRMLVCSLGFTRLNPTYEYTTSLDMSLVTSTSLVYSQSHIPHNRIPSQTALVVLKVLEGCIDVFPSRLDDSYILNHLLADILPALKVSV